MTKKAKEVLERLTTHYYNPPRLHVIANATYEETGEAFKDLSKRHANWEKGLDALAEEFCAAYRDE